MNFNWLFTMAWRDSRRSRSRLALFMSSIVLGIAALVGINSFGDNLARSIREQARELLGADLVLSSTQPFDPKLLPALQKLGQTRSDEASFASLVSFPRTQGVRLAQVRALGPGFPYYGDWETQPAAAGAQFRAGQSMGALVDDVLLAQFDARVGDSVKVGSLTVPIVGRVLKTPGQTGFSAAVAPKVFIPKALLDKTGLIRPGSRVQYRTYYRFAPGTDVAATIKPLESKLEASNIDSDTVASRQQSTGRAFQDLTRFLSLVAFVALLLGCVGVASAVNLYVQEKLASVAVLRCLGASGRQALLIYLIQTSGLGLLGAIIGAALGAVVQLVLPQVLGSFLPVTVSVAVSPAAVGLGLLTGLAMAVLFALLPLLAIRRVSPLRVLRASFEEDTATPDPLRGLVLAVVGLFIVGFAYAQTREWKQALGFAAGLLLALGALAGLGLGLRYLLRRYFPAGWSYVARQGLANLFRPQNQTVTLIISLGLGTFLLATLYLTQSLLLSRVQLSASGRQPNLVLFDIQTEQEQGVEQLLAKQHIPVMQRVPIVTMRLAAINRRTVGQLRKDTASGVPLFALTREYRVTYRDTLSASEKLVAGTPPRPAATPGGLPRVSVDANYFQRVKLRLGDTLTFNVQGAPLAVVVGGTREVDWARVQTNFLVVFPTGVLEQAPQFHVILTHVNNNQQLALAQRALVRDFPNVSAIDLGLILQTVDEILSKISFVIRFMAGFSILTGLLVLASSVLISRYQRTRESVLLRTLGASRRQILRITVLEYALLGFLAALAGVLLAGLAAWALAVWVFETPFVSSSLLWLPALVGLVAGLTALIGGLNSRSVLNQPPLAVLRAEG
ncbi:ABC transporter permease [Hymenobacter baengnokdamensis]|uniref:ABC transporter permease n=1 Tax=Hymenobacter baengnokdamensis TaxID=2615203 RepID=UPI001E2E00AF|nr:FtsX-like permease family protein [Hymenobacter baengnokdamensis]